MRFPGINTKTRLLLWKEMKSPLFLSALVVVVLYNVLVSQAKLITYSSKPGWIFDQAPRRLGAAVTPWIFIGLVAAWIGRVLVTVLFTYQIYSLSRGRKLTLRASLKGLRLAAFRYYAGFTAALFVFASAALFALWGLGWTLWRFERFDSTYLLVVIAALGYPVYVALLSGGALVAVVPEAWKVKVHYLRALFGPTYIRSVYLLYGLRVLVEYGVAALVLVAAVGLGLHGLVARLVGSLVILLPLLLMRTATYAKTVQSLSRKDDAYAIVLNDHI